MKSIEFYCKNRQKSQEEFGIKRVKADICNKKACIYDKIEIRLKTAKPDYLLNNYIIVTTYITGEQK